MGAKLCCNGAANSSPPPCGEGLGVGVVEWGSSAPQPPDPPPQPSPTRGEGVAAAWPQIDLAPICSGPAAAEATTPATASPRMIVFIATLRPRDRAECRK